MGYTHHWYREREIDPVAFKSIVTDFKRLLPLFKIYDIKLGDGLGKGSPILSESEVIFDGLEKCGHPKNHNIIIPWPAERTKNGVAPDSDRAVVGSWYAGVVLEQRTCDGDCSYEPFAFPRVIERDEPVGETAYLDMYGNPVPPEKHLVGRYCVFCKTAFRPYDLAVQCFLIIAKHHLMDKIIIFSDGEIQNWIEAFSICKNAFGYQDFKLGF